MRGESRFSDHRPVYSIFTAEVQIPSQSQFSGITRSASLLGVDELRYPTYPRSYMDINFYWLCISMEAAKVCIFYGPGSITLFKACWPDWCSEFHVKAFFLLIITPHVVLAADLPRYLSGRAHLLMTDWRSFLPRFHRLECLLLTGDSWTIHSFCLECLCPSCLEPASAYAEDVFPKTMFGKNCCNWHPNSYCC